MIRYRPLFQVDIVHDYFLSRGDVVFEANADADRAALSGLYAVNDYLEIVPDQTTVSTLAGHKMLFRATGTGFTVAVRLDPLAADIRPLVPPPADFKLTFALRLAEAEFGNYTELGPVTTGFYRLGNDSQNSTAAVNFLSSPVPVFSATRKYVAGEIRAEASGATFNLFLALRDTGPAAAPVAADWRRIPPDTWSAAATFQKGDVVLFSNQIFRALVDSPGTDLTKTTDWQAVGTLGNQYVTVTDAILPVPALFNLDISDASLAQATIRVIPAGGTAAATEQTFTAAQGTLSQVQIDLRGLAPGRYRVVILDSNNASVRELPCFLSPRAIIENWFGVIEIGIGTGNFALLNNDGTLRTPRYVARFLNRATRWRYIFPAAQKVGTGADVAVDSGNNSILVTPDPRPLTRFGAGSRLQADSPATPAVNEEIFLPAPEVKRIRHENAEWFSETHVPNITVGP
jgi:hypothetical protein